MRLPSIGSRVSLRYRSPTGADQPLTDVVGHLEARQPSVLIRTKSGELVGIDPAAVLSVRELSHTPVRTSQIRALEHAAALACPGTEQQWLHGWLARAAGGYTIRVDSAVPLDFSATLNALPAIIDWYSQRGLPAVLALPERVLPVRVPGSALTRVMVRDRPPEPTASGATGLSAAPDSAWLAVYEDDLPVEVLTAVVDGEVVFAVTAGAAVGRGALTRAPDGTRWLGVSAVRVVPEQRRRGYARTICDSLFTWGAQLSAQHAYVEVPAEDAIAIAFFEAMGFRLHHTRRYVEAAALLTHTI